MGKVEEIEALVAQVSAMWSGDRRGLYAALVANWSRLTEWEDDLSERIEEATGLSCIGAHMISDAVVAVAGQGVDAIAAIDFDVHGDLGDPTVEIELILTPDVEGLEEEDLARAGGCARYATFFLSAALPRYRCTVTELRHDPVRDVWEHHPDPEIDAAQRAALGTAHELIRAEGFAEVGVAALDQPVGEAWTDLYDPGEAQLQDCLFTDIERYSPDRNRSMTSSVISGTFIAGVVSNSTLSDGTST